jgi:hypothetical protein
VYSFNLFYIYASICKKLVQYSTAEDDSISNDRGLVLFSDYRGCTLFINFETEQECRKIGTIKCDPNTVSTFELFLTLKQGSRNTWHSMLPQFLKWVAFLFGIRCGCTCTCNIFFIDERYSCVFVIQKFHQGWHYNDF